MPYSYFDAREYPKHERCKALEEIYAPLCGVDIDASDPTSNVHVAVRTFSDFAISNASLTKHRAYRSYQNIADGDDSMFLILPRNGSVGINHRRRGVVNCSPGEMHLTALDHPFVCSSEDNLRVTAISLPSRWVETRLARINERVLKTSSPENSGAMQLLTCYLDSVLAMDSGLSAQSEQWVGLHVQDLISLVLGTNAEESRTAHGRGARYARLLMIREYIRNHLTDPALTTESVASNFGISPQYVRKIFQESGTTFSDYLNGLRLEWVFDQLSGSNMGGRQVGTLAYEVGFNNLAWFNRSFRNRFDMTPTEVSDTLFTRQLQ